MSSTNSSTFRTPSPSPYDELDSVGNLSIAQAPETSMEEVRGFFRGMSNTAILRYGLGFDLPDAPALAKDTVVIVMDCEKFEHEPRCLTEFGLHTFTRKEMATALSNPGPHGENLLRQVWYYHIRLLETAHYVNRTFCPGNPEKNHFGNTRFTTDQQAKDFLTESFSWPINNVPGAGKCPVILLGHAVDNDVDMLRELGVDPSVISNVVAIIDTQKIARTQGVHGRGDKIGLQALMEHYDVDFRDGHTAGNDAAYTMIGALQMVMKTELRDNTTRSLQEIVNDLEVFSKGFHPDIGIANHCTRCGRKDHNRTECYGRIERCKKCLKANKTAAAYTHITKLCTR